ncbi:hypothetical protein ABL78_1546 [Leptomonas seymouri]|uniref:FHA domain-containing protein n=1 Tax=Leptomonas seymouri TaxID=5684 RepID=A0A0N0P8B2_LEPSE|nr:hypothetical protein ABL78_1546 [Leptomonas seymouri]|eukprot:KPI89317.1 hypothetical protein ABL78_1546 [Leptomonas seymouri]
MYILEVNHGGGEIHRHFLLPGQTYTLGRKECRILLPAAEPSISRHHATIIVASMPRYSVLDPSAQLEIRIEDVSKHGTFVDRERVGKDNTRFLYPEDRIRFGLRVTARIIPMMLILGISPDLTDENLDIVLDAAVHIGALVVEDVIPAPLKYYERHTNCVGFLYVAEDNFVMEETMMQALGYGYTLVTPGYITHLVKCLEEKDTLMPSEFPTPLSPSPASIGLRAVHYRRPAQTFFSVTEFLSMGRPIAASVFHRHTFLMLDDRIRSAYEGVIKQFGGTTEPLALDTIPQWRAQHPQVGPYPLTTCVLVAEDDFRAISEDVMERGGGRRSMSNSQSRPHVAGYLRLYQCGVCLIPEENVHLALYRNDSRELNTKTTACCLQRNNEDMLADTASATPTLAPAPTAAAAKAAKATSVESAFSKGNSPSSEVVATASAAAGRRSNGSMRGSQSPHRSLPASPNVTYMAPAQRRRSLESACATVPSASPAGSGDKSSAATIPLTPASPSSLPVAAERSGSRAGSCVTHSAGPPLQRPAPNDSVVPNMAAAAPQPKAAPAVAACAPLTPSQPPPALNAGLLASKASASLNLNQISSDSSTATPDVNSATSPIATTPPVTVKPPASSPEALASRAATAPTTTESVTVGTSASADENHSNSHELEATTSGEANSQLIRSRLVRPRASHPFSLALRPRHNSDNNSDEDEGEVPDNERVTSSTAEANGVEEDGSAVPPQTRCTTQSTTRRSSVGGRRHSLGAQPSPVICPLKSEEVLRPRSRTASGSQQSASAVGFVGVGRRSLGHSEERPPLPPSEDGQQLITMEEAQRRRSGSMELRNQGGPPLLPTRTPSTTSIATATATPSVPEVASSNEVGATHTHTSVRRGEQRLASASAPPPRRSVVRVNLAIVNSQAERSASPQQGSTKLRRFSTPEHGVVVHTAMQVNKSPPRQRVEAVRINNATSARRRSSVSREAEVSISRHTSLEDDSASTGGRGSMSNHRSVLRRESINTVSRPPPPNGSVTRRASSSFHRSDSAQLQEKATPQRLTTPRVSSSVPRRRSKIYGSVQRQRSPELTAGEGEPWVTNSSSLTNPGPSAAAPQVSIRRRRSSPTQGSGAGGSSSSSGGAAIGRAAPGQIPGLRGSSAAPFLGGAGNSTAEGYFRINDELSMHCQKFMKEFMDDFMSETERVTRSVVRQTYMDVPSKETLESGVERILEFLQYINSTESDIPSMYSTGSTRAACHQVRQKSQYTLSKIKACYKTVSCKIPQSLTRARAALSTRNASPTQRRLNSVAVVHEAGTARRQSTL